MSAALANGWGMNGDGSKASAPNGLADFWNELNGDGCDMRHIQQMLSRIRIERAEAAASAARIYFNGKTEEPLSLLDLADQLRELRCQALSLELAIIGAFNEPKLHSFRQRSADAMEPMLIAPLFESCSKKNILEFIFCVSRWTIGG